MPDLYRVRIESVHGKCLTCRVTELYGDGYLIEPSLSLAFGFLWDTTEWDWWMRRLLVDGAEFTNEQIQAAARSTPLGQELEEHDFNDTHWCLDNAKRFVSCFGVVDRHIVIVGEDGLWSHISEGEETHQATCNISVTSLRWIEHLASGMEWESRVWNRDRSVVCDSVWRTSDVMALAKSINESHDFSAMPVLADALQEAGCDSADLLNHLRDASATHVRGCWALDLVLGKE